MVEMAAASSCSQSLENPETSDDTRHELMKKVRSHEVAIAELNSLSSSRLVYQRNGQLFFRTSIPKAIADEQKQINIAKSKVENCSVNA